MRRSIILAGLCALLGACATEAKYQQVLNTWLGSNETPLVEQWGPPDRIYELEGNKYITYVRGRTVYLPGEAPSSQTTFIGNTAYTNAVGGMPPMMINQSTVTTFTIKDGKITDWRYEGNSCKSK
jgi:hypothetical protein